MCQHQLSPCDAIFDVVQQTFRHEWIFIKVYKMRSLKEQKEKVN